MTQVKARNAQKTEKSKRKWDYFNERMAIFALKALRPSNAAANLLVTKVTAKRRTAYSLADRQSQQ
jgi:hypothetical protein